LLRRIAAFALLTACTPQASPERTGLPLHDCALSGSPRPARCGVVERPEHPGDPTGRMLSLQVSVIPATVAPARTPLFLLAGGPGQGAREAFGPLLPGLVMRAADRDLVLVDQRGTGGSGALSCRPEHPTLADRLRDEVDRTVLERCLADFDADPTQYVTSIAVDDLDAVRAQLGYEHIDLYGGSYGTRVALVYARQYPAHTGKLVLDGVAPVDMTLPLSFARDAQAAIDRAFADCAADPSCATAFPDAAASFSNWLATLDAPHPPVQVSDPRTDARESIELGRTVVGHAVRSVLYSPELTTLLPHVLRQAERGTVAPLLSVALSISDAAADTMSIGMFLSVVCAEDVPFLEPDAIDGETAKTFLGTATIDTFKDACALWPRADLPDGYRDPVESDAPTLLLSGELDPVTPPRWAEHVLPHLTNGRHVIVPGAGHGTISNACALDLVDAFLDGEALDLDCLVELKRPPFFIDFAGPPA